MWILPTIIFALLFASFVENLKIDHFHLCYRQTNESRNREITIEQYHEHLKKLFDAFCKAVICNEARVTT